MNWGKFDKEFKKIMYNYVKEKCIEVIEENVTSELTMQAYEKLLKKLEE